MNKLSVLIISLAVVVFSAFSTASATDLKSAWLEYETARNTLNDSYAQVNAAWAVLNDASENGFRANYLQYQDNWDIIDNSWAEVDAARTIVASTLKITLSDSSERGIRSRSGPFRPLSMRWIRDNQNAPWTPEPTWGSWDELSQAWASLDEAWAVVNAAWAEIDDAWIALGQANEILARLWTEADAEWTKINAAWAEIDAAWKTKH